MKRIVSSEILDRLPTGDPRAVHSRGDLVRLNWMMGHAGIVSGHLREVYPEQGPRPVVDLGAGDGRFFLRVARMLGPAWHGSQVTLLDRQPIVSDATRGEFAELGWSVKVVEADVFDWLGKASASPELVVANLFVHHFEDESLAKLFGLVSDRCRHFVACEPRRAGFPLLAARLLWFVGCNQVTRHDAAVSVCAGFAGEELSSRWPGRKGWELAERGAGLFSHFFAAWRTD